jgi:hypothetical protein
MKTNVLIGIALIVLGVIAFAYQGINWTTRHKAVDLGPIQITTETTKTIPLPPIVGAIALIGGIGLLVANTRRA